MKHVALIGLLAAGLLAGCEDGSYDEAEAGAGERMYAISDEVTVTGSRQARDGFMASAPQPAPPPPPSLDNAQSSGGPQVDDVVQRLIAYSFNYQLETPADATASLIDRHREACLGAGADTCQVINANVYEQGHGVAGTLSLRALPVWIETFRGGLADDVDAADGRIRNQSQSAQDLTSTIYDMEARLEAKRTLRTRLTALLERPGASVEEMVQVERELARVQGDIEGSEAQIRAMRGRVSMSALTLNYTSRVEPVSRSAFDPLDRALRNLTGNFARGLANMLTFLAGFLPWLIVIVPTGWFLTRWFGGMLKRRREAAAKT